MLSSLAICQTLCSLCRPGAVYARNQDIAEDKCRYFGREWKHCPSLYHVHYSTRVWQARMR